MSTQRKRGFFSGPSGWVLLAFVAIGLFLLISEHRAHLGFAVPYVPLALLGLCLVLHSYMHGVSHARDPDEKPDDQGPHNTSHRHH